jgi:ProP effector
VGYLETLKAGTPRIDLDGNPVGKVTVEGQEYAQRKLAKAARRPAKAIEDREAANQAAAKPVEKRAEQQNPIPEAKPQQPTPAPIAGPPRVGLAGLRAAALKRRQIVAAE